MTQCKLYTRAAAPAAAVAVREVADGADVVSQTPLLWSHLLVHKYRYFACNLPLCRPRLSVGLYDGLSVG